MAPCGVDAVPDFPEVLVDAACSSTFGRAAPRRAAPRGCRAPLAQLSGSNPRDSAAADNRTVGGIRCNGTETFTVVGEQESHLRPATWASLGRSFPTGIQ